MKIAIDARALNHPQKTGVEVWVKNLIENLAKIGSKHQYILYSDKPLNCPQILKRQNFIQKIVNFPFFWTQIGLSLHFINNKELPDVFLFPAHSIPIWCPTKSLVFIQDLAFLKFPDHFTGFDLLRLKNITQASVNNADLIIAPSFSTKKDIIKSYKISSQKIKVIPLGYDQKVFKPQKQIKVQKTLKKLKINFPYILYLGTLQRRKNLITLISAFDRLKKYQKIKEKLVIAGKKGWLYDDIFETVKNLDLKKEVIFLGYVKDGDVPNLLSGAKVLVLLSLYEGFGLPVLEAMACGCPVVCSSNSSLPEVAGKAAVLVNPKKTNQVAQAIYQVLTNQKLSKTLKKKGLEQAQKFSWQKHTREILTAIEKL